MLGLKRGEVFLCPHDISWEIQARETAKKLKSIMGDTAVDIQHVGSTAVKNIKAKPIIDIAVAATGLDDVLTLKNKLEQNGFYYQMISISSLVHLFSTSVSPFSLIITTSSMRMPISSLI